MADALERRLAVVLAAAAVGYSQLLSREDEATAVRLVPPNSPSRRRIAPRPRV